MTAIAADGARPVRVLGLGNVLLGDDAFGPYVVRQLEAQWELPEGVEVHDLGTPGGDLIPFLTDAAAVIVVDTVSSSGPPGSVRLYRRDELPPTSLGPRTSPHEPGLFEALATAELVERAPHEALLVGVVPHTVDTGTGLSPDVLAAVGEVLDAIVAELERLGRRAVRRAAPREADIWWL